MACKPKRRGGSQSKDYNIAVGTFSRKRPVVKVPIIPGVTTVRFVKTTVTQQLELDGGSQNIFGLFLGGRLSDSVKILQEDDKFTNNMLESSTGRRYFFQRVAFDYDKETDLLCVHTAVTLLLYNEFKEVFARKLIYPPLTEEQSTKIKELMDKANENEAFADEFLEFVQRGLSQYYWDHYHRVQKCTLLSIVTAAEPRAKEGSAVSVSVNFNSLIITYVSGEDPPFDFIFKWDKVRSVDIDRVKCCAVFEVLLVSIPGEKYENILRAISIQSDKYEYIYSMAKYFLIIHDKIAKYESEIYEEQQLLEKEKVAQLREVMSRLNKQELSKARARIEQEEQAKSAKRTAEAKKEAAVLPEASHDATASEPEKPSLKTKNTDTSMEAQHNQPNLDVEETAQELAREATESLSNKQADKITQELHKTIEPTAQELKDKSELLGKALPSAQAANQESASSSIQQAKGATKKSDETLTSTQDNEVDMEGLQAAAARLSLSSDRLPIIADPEPEVKEPVKAAAARLSLSDDRLPIIADPEPEVKEPVKYENSTFWQDMSPCEKEYYKKHFEDEKKVNDTILAYKKEIKSQVEVRKTEEEFSIASTKESLEK